MAAKMIEEGRLKATIDQLRQVIVFEDANTSQLRAWDVEIQECCSALNTVLEKIAVEYEDYRLA